MLLGQTVPIKVSTRGFEVLGYGSVVTDLNDPSLVRFHIVGENTAVENGSVDFYIPALDQPAVLITMLDAEIEKANGVEILNK